MEYSGATITERAVRRRVERFFERQDFENGVTKSGEDVVPSPDSTTPPRDAVPRPDSDYTTLPQDAVPRPVSTTPPRILTRQKSSSTKAQKEAIDNLPDWMRLPGPCISWFVGL